MGLILAAGFNGFVAIGWAEGCLKLMQFKFGGGGLLVVMRARSGPAVLRVTTVAVLGRGRRFCSGHTIHSFSDCPRFWVLGDP